MHVVTIWIVIENSKYLLKMNYGIHIKPLLKRPKTSPTLCIVLISIHKILA